MIGHRVTTDCAEQFVPANGPEPSGNEQDHYGNQGDPHTVTPFRTVHILQFQSSIGKCQSRGAAEPGRAVVAHPQPCIAQPAAGE